MYLCIFIFVTYIVFGRISPRSRVQHAQFGSQLLLGMNNDIQSQSLIQPQTSHLNVPRTPGAEGVSVGSIQIRICGTCVYVAHFTDWSCAEMQYCARGR